MKNIIQQIYLDPDLINPYNFNKIRWSLRWWRFLFIKVHLKYYNIGKEIESEETENIEGLINYYSNNLL